MRSLHRFTFAALASSVVLAVACGGQTSGPGGGSGSACADYYKAYFAGGCLPGTPPADEVARTESRWNTLCEGQLALPGEGITHAQIEACAQAVRSGGCNAVTTSSACAIPSTGTLADGAACESDAQCTSGRCFVPASGGPAPSACGTCAQTAAVGESCSGKGCGAGAACADVNGTSACEPRTQGAAGAACNGLDKACAEGLLCSAATLTCSAPAAAGEKCAAPSDCAWPLTCPPSTAGGSTCTNLGQSGAPCNSDDECASGFGCDSTARTCSAIAWVAAGQPCNAGARCLVGHCPYDASGQPQGVCPTVIADGQPCDTSNTGTTCDTFAQCLAGSCVLTFGCQ